MNRFKSFFALIFLNLMAIISWAQTPTHIPRKRHEPVNFFESTENIIFYIVIPVIIVLLYFLWRRDRARQKKKYEEEQRKKNS
ncbi:MAG: hypothetical protein K0B37_04300 [Bacteroidales bacterium]|nr:hypothetical protein [Bacteroidales bacterium]